MKKYLLFTFFDYYPSGGWHDFDDSFDELEAAKARADSVSADQAQIVSTETGEIVAERHGKTWA